MRRHHAAVFSNWYKSVRIVASNDLRVVLVLYQMYPTLV